MATFFDDGDGDMPGEWSGESPDAWKSKGEYNPGFQEQFDRESFMQHVAAKEDELDREFKTNGNYGRKILQPEILEVCELMDVILPIIKEKPYFAHKELGVMSRRVDSIESSKYCRFAMDQNETLAELAFMRSDISTLKKQAYGILEGRV